MQDKKHVLPLVGVSYDQVEALRVLAVFLGIAAEHVPEPSPAIGMSVVQILFGYVFVLHRVPF